MLPTLAHLQKRLQEGAVTAVSLTEQALANAQAPQGQGASTFTKRYAEQARLAAQASDLLRQSGIVRSPLEGLPVSIKDLFDVAGEPTTAGSRVLAHAPAATRHAQVVERLLQAGAIVVGKTNMTEFAFSGLGLNPHYGTPASPWEKDGGRRIPGGSSSGAAVSVAEGMAALAIGTDTGGSVRIPSAFCGLTGFKPTARRIPMQGVLPLSASLDSVGPLAASVHCCAVADAVLSGQLGEQAALDGPSGGLSARRTCDSLRFLVPSNVVLDGADAHVQENFAQTLERLRHAGATIVQAPVPAFSQLADINRKGGLTCAEAWHWHRNLLQAHSNAYDPRVASRILRGQSMDAADYLDVLRVRPQWIAAVAAQMQGFDALLMPTVPVIAPRIDALQNDEALYYATNALILRNPTLINFLDGCALSLPSHGQGQPPMGLMVAGLAMQDAQILAIGQCLEQVLQAA